MSLSVKLRPPGEVHHRLVRGSPAGVLKANFGGQKTAEDAWAMLKIRKANNPDTRLNHLWHTTNTAVSDWCIVELEGPEQHERNEWGEISF